MKIKLLTAAVAIIFSSSAIAQSNITWGVSVGVNQPWGWNQPQWGHRPPQWGWNQPAWGWQQPAWGWQQPAWGWQQPVQIVPVMPGQVLPAMPQNPYFPVIRQTVPVVTMPVPVEQPRHAEGAQFKWVYDEKCDCYIGRYLK
jgi:hypothetical protein